MTNAKHTPGPWLCHPSPVDDSEYRVFNKDGDYLTLNDEEHTANARLIAAAPEMLEELKRQLDWLRHIQTRIDGIPESVMLGFQQADKNLSKIIAKAEGGAE